MSYSTMSARISVGKLSRELFVGLMVGSNRSSSSTVLVLSSSYRKSSLALSRRKDIIRFETSRSMLSHVPSMGNETNLVWSSSCQ